MKLKVVKPEAFLQREMILARNVWFKKTIFFLELNLMCFSKKLNCCSVKFAVPSIVLRARPRSVHCMPEKGVKKEEISLEILSFVVCSRALNVKLSYVKAIVFSLIFLFSSSDSNLAEIFWTNAFLFESKASLNWTTSFKLGISASLRTEAIFWVSSLQKSEPFFKGTLSSIWIEILLFEADSISSRMKLFSIGKEISLELK